MGIDVLVPLKSIAAQSLYITYSYSVIVLIRWAEVIVIHRLDLSSTPVVFVFCSMK